MGLCKGGHALVTDLLWENVSNGFWASKADRLVNSLGSITGNIIHSLGLQSNSYAFIELV